MRTIPWAKLLCEMGTEQVFVFIAVRLPVDYDVLSLASAALPTRGVFRDEFAWIDHYVPEQESSA